MPYDFSTVDCAEVHGTAREEWTNVGRTAQVTLQTDWTNRYPLMSDILGNYRPWPYSAGLFPKSAAIQVRPEAYTKDGQGMDYSECYVNVKYGIPGQDDIPDPTELASESLEPTTEFLTEDPKLFQWKTAPVPANDAITQDLKEGEEPGKLIRGLRLVRTLYNITSINANILTLPGSCNSTQYVSGLLGLTFPAQTLLFIPPVISRTYTTAGTSAWTIQLGWEYKKDGWNKYWRKETQEYDTMVVRATGNDYESYPPENQAPWLP